MPCAGGRRRPAVKECSDDAADYTLAFAGACACANKKDNKNKKNAGRVSPVRVLSPRPTLAGGDGIPRLSYLLAL